MANIMEWAKGISVFAIITLLIYFAYDNIISGILTWVNDTSSILGAFGWAGFVIIYLLAAPLYMLYTIIAGSKGDTTNPGWILAGFSAFFLFLIIATAVHMIFAGVGGDPGLIDSLNSSTADLIDGDTTNLTNISWLAVFVAIVGCIGAPFMMLLQGYGKIDFKDMVASVKGGNK